MDTKESSKRTSKHNFKSGKAEKIEDVDQLCEGAMEFKHSIGFGHHSRNLPSHFTGIPSSMKRVYPPSSSTMNPWASSPPPGDGSSASNLMQKTHRMEIDIPDGPTVIGRYRVWHPEESLVTVVPAFQELVLPTVDEIVANYGLPYRRAKVRDDGIGGVALFQPPEVVPPGVEAAISKVMDLPQGSRTTCEFPDRERWDLILEGDYKKSQSYVNKKRYLSLGASTSEPGLQAIPDSQPWEAGSTRKKRKDDKPDPRLDLLLDYIKTGDDCVKFFIENKGRNCVKTFYCNRAETGNSFQPYNLVVVSRSKLNREHFSISYYGLVHCEQSIGKCKR